MPQTAHTFCRICEATCGLEVDVEGGRAVAVRPDPQHVATEGFGCPKGLRQHLIYQSPDRLLAPQRRVGARWESVGWDQANADIGARVKRLRAEHGPDSIAMYVGTAAGFSVLHPVFAQGFMAGLRSRSMFSSSTQDCSSKFAVARQIYGHPFTQPFPDLDRTECLIVVGANPVVSKWSFLQVVHPGRALKGIQGRGGKVFVVDPRRTETAAAASEHVFIRPGTDVWFYLAFLNELLARGGVDRELVARHSAGFERVEELARAWTPERAEEVTQIPAATLRRMVEAYRSARGAALYCSTGVNMGGQGALAFWLQEAINLASGNLDRAGGTLVGQGIIDFPAFGARTGTLMRSDLSRVGRIPSVNDAFAGALLADEILTPGKGQIRALFVAGGNPLITMPNSGRLREALARLELLVTVDLFRNETGSLAHYILPATSPLERPDLPFIFPLMLGMQRKPYLQATRAVAERPGDVRDEATIFLDLCRASGVALFGSWIAQVLLMGMTALRRRLFPNQPRSVPQELLLSLLLRLCGQGSFRRLLSEPHGRLRPPHQPGSFLGKRVLVPGGKVQLAPPALVEGAARLEREFAAEKARAGELKLITKRAVHTHNSWTHNLEEFVGGERSTNHVYLNPKDGERLGLAEGALADVSSRTATLRLPVKHLDALMPGTLALPHGWGHQHATGLSVAKRTRGVNVNLLAADGPEGVDPLSGMALLTGIPVTVKPAQAEQAASWSGLPQPEPALPTAEPGKPLDTRARDFGALALAYLAAGAIGALASSGVGTTWQALLAGMVASALAVFAVSFAADSSSAFDPYWSVAPMVAAPAIAWHAGTGAPTLRGWLMAALIVAWGARLTYNWASGFRALSHEDWRLASMRPKARRWYWLASLFGLHLAPTLLVYLGLLTVIPASAAGAAPLGVLDALALAVTAGAILLEAAADEQLRAFRRSGASGFMRRGLWSVVRHPNYLGEIGFWWGLGLFALAADLGAWRYLVGAVAITALFVLASIPMSDERSRERRPGYAEHMKQVPALIPRLGRLLGRAAEN